MICFHNIGKPRNGSTMIIIPIRTMIWRCDILALYRHYLFCGSITDRQTCGNTMESSRMKLLSPFVERSGFILNTRDGVWMGQYSVLVCDQDTIELTCYYQQRCEIGANMVRPFGPIELTPLLKFSNWHITDAGENYLKLHTDQGTLILCHIK